MRSIRHNETLISNNRLTQVGLSFHSDKYGKRSAVFRCFCGNLVIKDIRHVFRGETQSCGCFATEMRNKRHTTHGQAKTGLHTPTYNTWTAMRRRCKVNPYYVRNGIQVCDRWLIFENFFEDMGEKPDGLTLDRKDNKGNYDPINCRWATISEQQCNKSNNKIIVANGKRMCLSEWSRETGINRDTLKRRFQLGWTDDEIINTPVKQR